MKQLIGPGGFGIGRWFAPRAGAGLVLLLCLSVFMQMLGVPAPLLDAGGSFETGESSVQEGWSIHATAVHLPTSPHLALITVAQPSVCVPILTRVPFHPPLS
jgi:hypothetical protein